MYSPLGSVIRFMQLVFQNKIKLNKGSVGQLIRIQNNKYVIFRNVTVMEKYQNAPSVILILKFQFHHSSLKKDSFVSLFQIPIFAGLPGFQAKLWTYDPEDNFFQGVYQWASLQDAKNYLNSFAVNYVNKKAVKNSVSSIIYEDMELDKFMSKYVIERGLYGKKQYGYKD